MTRNCREKALAKHRRETPSSWSLSSAASLLSCIPANDLKGASLYWYLPSPWPDASPKDVILPLGWGTGARLAVPEERSGRVFPADWRSEARTVDEHVRRLRRLSLKCEVL